MISPTQNRFVCAQMRASPSMTMLDYNLMTNLVCPQLTHRPGACEYHNFLTSRVKWNIINIFDVESYRLVYIWVNFEKVKGGGAGGVGEWGGAPEFYRATFKKILNVFYGFISSSPFYWRPCWVIWLRGGGAGCLATEMHGMPPSRPRGCSGKLLAIDSKLAVHALHMHMLHEWSKKVLRQRFKLDSCTKQVISAGACPHRVLPYSSSGITSFGMKNVQANRCLDSEQIDTLFISVGGQEGGFGGRGHFEPEAPNWHVTVMNCYFLGSCRDPKLTQIVFDPNFNQPNW